MSRAPERFLPLLRAIKILPFICGFAAADTLWSRSSGQSTRQLEGNHGHRWDSKLAVVCVQSEAAQGPAWYVQSEAAQGPAWLRTWLSGIALTALRKAAPDPEILRGRHLRPRQA